MEIYSHTKNIYSPNKKFIPYAILARTRIVIFDFDKR